MVSDDLVDPVEFLHVIASNSATILATGLYVEKLLGKSITESDLMNAHNAMRSSLNHYLRHYPYTTAVFRCAMRLKIQDRYLLLLFNLLIFL